MIKIDKQIPIPELLYGGVARKYPFKELEVGDSFFVSYEEKIASMVINSVSSSCRTGQLKKKKFTVRDIKGDNGCRCWRVE